MKERIDTELPRMISQSHRLLFMSLFAHVTKYAVAAVGTVLATAGESRWVAVTVAYSTILSHLMAAYRIDDRRAAFAKATSALEGEKAWWMALGPEERVRQSSINSMVAKVEDALEATLPPTTSTAQVRVKPPVRDTASGASARTAACLPWTYFSSFLLPPCSCLPVLFCLPHTNLSGHPSHLVFLCPCVLPTAPPHLVEVLFNKCRYILTHSVQHPHSLCSTHISPHHLSRPWNFTIPAAYQTWDEAK